MFGTIRKVLKIANPIAINACHTTARFNIAVIEKTFWCCPKWEVIFGSRINTITLTHKPTPPTT